MGQGFDQVRFRPFLVGNDAQGGQPFPVPPHRGLNDFLAERNESQTSCVDFHNIPSSAPGYRPEPAIPTTSSTRNATILRTRLEGIGWSMGKRTEPLARGYRDNSRSNFPIAEGVG